MSVWFILQYNLPNNFLNFFCSFSNLFRSFSIFSILFHLHEKVDNLKYGNVLFGPVGHLDRVDDVVVVVVWRVIVNYVTFTYFLHI